MTTNIVFNSKAAEAMCAEHPTKVRIDASWKKTQGFRVLPTVRKVGPHMMLPIVSRAKGFVVEIDEVTMEKLHEEGMPKDYLQAGERYSVIDETYGWFVLLPGDEHESSVGIATVTVKK